jgi:hypothetical protein
VHNILESYKIKISLKYAQLFGASTR